MELHQVISNYPIATNKFGSDDKLMAKCVGLIFDRLDDTTLSKCRLVKKSWQQVIDADIFWNRITTKFPLVNGQSLLHTASYTGQLDKFKTLFESSNEKNPRDENGRTCMHYASLNNHTLLINYILDQSPRDVNPTDVNGITPLHQAASRGYFAICVLIMSRISDKNPSSLDGQTPLHLSAMYGHYSVCKLLLENIHNKNPPRLGDGRTPHDLVQFLLNSRNHSRISRLIRTHMQPLPNPNVNPRNVLSQIWNQLHLKLWNSKHETNFEIETISIRSGRDIFITPAAAKPFDLQPHQILEIDNMSIVKSFTNNFPGTGSDPEIFMELYKAKSCGAIIHSSNCAYSTAKNIA